MTRNNVATATKRAYDGEVVGLFRDGDDMIPIIARSLTEEQVGAAAELDLVQVPRGHGMRRAGLNQAQSDPDVAKGLFTVSWSSMRCPSCRSSVHSRLQPASNAAATISES